MDTIYTTMVSCKGHTDFSIYSKSLHTIGEFRKELEELASTFMVGSVVFVETFGERKGFNIYPIDHIIPDGKYCPSFVREELADVDNGLFVKDFSNMMPDGAIAKLIGPRYKEEDGVKKWRSNKAIHMSKELKDAIKYDLTHLGSPAY